MSIIDSPCLLPLSPQKNSTPSSNVSSPFNQGKRLFNNLSGRVLLSPFSQKTTPLTQRSVIPLSYSPINALESLPSSFQMSSSALKRKMLVDRETSERLTPIQQTTPCSEFVSTTFCPLENTRSTTNCDATSRPVSPCFDLLVPDLGAFNAKSSPLRNPKSSIKVPSTPVRKRGRYQEKLPVHYQLCLFYPEATWLKQAEKIDSGDNYVVYKVLHPLLGRYIARKTPRKYTPKGREYNKKEIDSMLNCSGSQHARLNNKTKNLHCAPILNSETLIKDGYIDMEIYPDQLKAVHLLNPDIQLQIKALIEYPFLVDPNERIDLKPQNIRLKHERAYLIDFLEVPPEDFDDREVILGQCIRLFLEMGVSKKIIAKLIVRLPEQIKSNIQKHQFSG